MARAAREIPPPLELLCLRSLWELGEANVKDVQQRVAAQRPLAYTTIMTVLERLVRKGKLTRRKVGRAFLYAPASSREAMREIAVKELLEAFFDGRSEDLLAYLHATGVQAAAAGAGVDEKPAAHLDPALL